MRAVVLEGKLDLTVRDIDIVEDLGPRDVRIAMRRVGICGSDVHYYLHGEMGPFVVEEPLVLGHEGSGTVIETGAEVTHLAVGDRVCMEPGIPNPHSKAVKLGLYHLDPDVRFWSVPPYHGCLRETVVHPAEFTYRLPDEVDLAAGAMAEPLAVAMHSAAKARIRPGDIAVVTGAGTIGLLTALCVVASGCSRVLITDVAQEKLELAEGLGPIRGVNVMEQDPRDVVTNETDGWGADVVLEASGVGSVAASTFDLVCPGGTIVLIGVPHEPFPHDVLAAQLKEARVEHVFRYAHVYDRAVAMMASGQIDVSPLITDVFDMDDGVEAFKFAADMPPGSVKAQIRVADDA